MRRAVKTLMLEQGHWNNYRIIRSNCHGTCPNNLQSILVCGIGTNTQNKNILCSPKNDASQILESCLQIMQEN
jgi:hypothetical protein